MKKLVNQEQTGKPKIFLNKHSLKNILVLAIIILLFSLGEFLFRIFDFNLIFKKDLSSFILSNSQLNDSILI